MIFVCASILAWIAVVLAALRWRNRFFATFAGVLLGIHTLVTIALRGYFAVVWPLYAYLQLTVYVHFVTLIRPRMRPGWWRALFSIPAMFFLGGSLLAMPWAVVAGLGFEPLAAWAPYAAALAGVAQGLFTRESVVDVALDGRDAGDEPRRYPRGGRRGGRPLRIVQITDPHLGPWMSEHKLRRICERTVAREPDIVALTGDFLTMESHRASERLAWAFEPLRAMQGRVFACRGNHDFEAPDSVARALDHAGVRLLVDDATTLETPAGRVQVLGIDYRFRERQQHLNEVCARHPRLEGALRLVLLHDPSAFRLLPEGEGDLVLSGHTHGGQVGLVSLGLPWTLLRVFASIPDHGLWARGRDRLYVHRGTGHYGFPLRVGVPAERSLLRVYAATDSQA